MQLDFIRLVLCAYCSLRDGVLQCTPKVSRALTRVSLLYVWADHPGWAGLSTSSTLDPILLFQGSQEHVRPCMRQAGVMTDISWTGGPIRILISRTEAAIAAQSTIQYLPIQGHRIRCRQIQKVSSCASKRSISLL